MPSPRAAALIGIPDLGTLAAGKSADFLVLFANPLDDINNTRRIDKVYLKGVALDRAFDSILRDLRTQYLLGYYPKNVPLTRNRFHTIKVETQTPGLRVQTRSGYYGDSAP